MMKRTLATVLCMITLFALGGCASGTEHSDADIENKKQETISEREVEEFTPNERQKRIMELAGLPKNIDEMSDDNIRDLIRIEEMLSYMDKKYDAKFMYKGYSDGSMEEEWLNCYVEEGYDLKEEDSIFVEVNEDGEFTDNFMDYTAKAVYSDLFFEHLTKLGYTADNAKVFVDRVTETDLNDITQTEDVTPEKLRDNILAYVEVFLFGDFSEEELSEMAEACGKWHDDMGYDVWMRFTVVDTEDAFDGLNEFTFSDFLSWENDKYSTQVDYSMTDGEFFIY